MNQEWYNYGAGWQGTNRPWDIQITYKKASNSTLYSAGEYVILANSYPYLNVQKINGVQEYFDYIGVGTILKKEFRYCPITLKSINTMPNNLNII